MQILYFLALFFAARAFESTSRPHPASCVSEPDEKRKFEIAEAIAEQLFREQQLTSNRMNWNLTFQGFLFTAFSFTYANLSSFSSLGRLFIQAIIVFGGISVGLATKHSILASQYQRDFLKRTWENLYKNPDRFSFPRPFAQNSESIQGRKSSTAIIRTILIMWAGLGGLAIITFVTTDWRIAITLVHR